MKCHYCGNSVGITATLIGDSDFCSSDHRTRYVARLTKGMALVGCESSQHLRLAAPITRYAPMDSSSAIIVGLSFSYALRMPGATLAIATADPADSEQPAAETVEAVAPVVTPIAAARPAARTKPAALPAADSSNRLDRLSALAARIRGLREELNGAAEIPRLLATA